MNSIRKKIRTPILLLLFLFISAFTIPKIVYADNVTNTEEGSKFRVINVTIEESPLNLSKGDAVSASGYDVEISQSGDLKTDTQKVFDGLLDIVAAVGAVIVTFGLGKMFMAFKDDNAGAKADAMNVLIVGFLVMGIGGILNTMIP